MTRKQPQRSTTATRNASAFRIGERALISAIRTRALTHSKAVRMGIGDDCAILRPPASHEIVVTTDLSLENVHFRLDWHSPESVGHRCLARGLSDLAAMGAQPLGAFLSIALPPELALRQKGGSWFDRFLDGLLALAQQADVPLAGGDTAQSPALLAKTVKQASLAVADIVLVGSVKRGRALLRSGARAGDIIYVTGALGGAAAELLAVERTPARFAGLTKAVAGHPHFFPVPRLQVAARLAARSIHSCIDLSDGLSTDLAHICTESEIAAQIDAEAIPTHPLARQAAQHGWTSSALNLALHGGEDYELLFTASKKARVPRQIAGIAVHPIGEIIKRKARQPQITLRYPNGKITALESKGWQHFTT